MLKTIAIIAAAIAALYFIPVLRTILRWIIFLPVAFLAGFLFQFIDIPGLIVSWIASVINSTLGLIFDVVDLFMAFFLITIIARTICPISKIGWGISFSLCLLLSVFNLIDCHVYDLFPLGARDPGAPVPAIIWWHVVILVAASLAGGFATYGDGE